MKAKAVKLVSGRYEECAIEEATHLTFRRPGPAGLTTLPVIQSGTRQGTGCWSWNGSLETPTLRPSIYTRGHGFECHCFLTLGMVHFLDDCNHEFTGEHHPLLNVEGPPAEDLV